MKENRNREENMSFKLSDEVKAIKDMAAEFAQKDPEILTKTAVAANALRRMMRPPFPSDPRYSIGRFAHPQSSKLSGYLG